MVKKKITKASKTRLLVFGTLSCLAIGSLFASIVNYSYSIAKLEKQKAFLENKLLSLKEEEQELKTEIQKLKDPEYIARYARENYLYSKNGEYIIKIEKEKTKEEEFEDDSDKYYPYIMTAIAGTVLLMVLYIIKRSRKK